MVVCNKCKKICKKTKFGIYVIICDKDIILCMECYHNKIIFDNFKFNHNVLKFLRKREITNLENKLLKY